MSDNFKNYKSKQVLNKYSLDISVKIISIIISKYSSKMSGSININIRFWEAKEI